MVVSCLKLLAKKRKNSLTLHNPIDFIESIMKLIKEEMFDQGGLHTRPTKIPPLSHIPPSSACKSNDQPFHLVIALVQRQISDIWEFLYYFKRFSFR